MNDIQANLELTMLITTVTARLSGLKDKLKHSKPLDKKEKVLLDKIKLILILHSKQLTLLNQNNSLI